MQSAGYSQKYNTRTKRRRKAKIMRDIMFGSDTEVCGDAADIKPSGIDMMIRWIPEPKEHPGYYALSLYINISGNTTSDINKAMQFMTKAECQEWCDTQKTLAWVPREHSVEA